MANYRFQLEDTTADADTLTHRIYQTLRDEIVTGVIRPGARMVRRTLSKRLGVSPMPVTEALLKLEQDGLVESRPLHGCRVRPLNIEDVKNDQVFREAIECQAARLCAEHGSPADLAALANKARTVDRLLAQGDPGSRLGMDVHLDFHVAIATIGGYPRLAEELSWVWFRRLMRLNWLKGTLYDRSPVDWHQQLVQAITSGDPEVAERSMREHVRFNQLHDLEALQVFLDSGAAAAEVEEPNDEGEKI